MSDHLNPVNALLIRFRNQLMRSSRPTVSSDRPATGHVPGQCRIHRIESRGGKPHSPDPAYATNVQDLQCRRHRRRPGTVSRQRLDRRPADRSAYPAGGRGLSGMGDDPARLPGRHRTGPRPAGHRRETCDQRRHGRLPADAFPGRADRLYRHAGRRIPAARRHRQHRRLCRLRRSERPDPPRDRRLRQLQRARQLRSCHRGHRPSHPARADQHHAGPARRNRPFHTRPSRQVQLLRRRGRGRHHLATAGPTSRHAARRLRRHGHGRAGARARS